MKEKVNEKHSDNKAESPTISKTNSDDELRATLEKLRGYNPQFKLTPEVLEILKRFYADFKSHDDTGRIDRNELIDRVLALDAEYSKRNLSVLIRPSSCTTGSGRQEEAARNDRIDFEEFCELILRWRDESPSSLELLYNSWVEREVADFAGDNSVFPMEAAVPLTSDTCLTGPSSSTIITSRKTTVVKPTVDSSECGGENNATTDADAWITMTKSFIAGGCAGIVSKSALAPIDRVKIIFQVTESRFSIPKAFELGKSIYTSDGFWALFRGNSATVLRVMPYAGIQHSSFDYFRRLIMKYNDSKGSEGTEDEYLLPGRLSKLQTVLAGSLAGGLSVTCTYPLDIIRARLLVQQGKQVKYSGIISGVMEMYKAQGLQSFSRGLFPTLLGILPYTGIGFALNEYMKQELLTFQVSRASGSTVNDSHRLSTLEKFSCSYVAACFAQSVTYPLDTIRRRMQTEGFITDRSGVKVTQHHYSSVFKTGRYILNHEGWRGLFKGLSVNWMRSPVATGISLTAYDALKELMEIERIK